MTSIMVVDDEAAITTQLEERLTSMGYKAVPSASSGQEAVQKARKNEPDLILMDIVMPGKMDGIKAAALIKEELNIPVVFLTAYGDDKFIQRAKKVEPLGYIIKPYNENELKAAVEIALLNKEIFRELKNSEKEWRELAEDIHEGIVLTDKDRNIFFWNKGAENIFGYHRNEAKKKPLDFILSEGTKKIVEDRIDDLISSEKKALSSEWLEVVGVKKDYSRFPMEMILNIKKVKNNDYFICIVRDITKQKIIESQMETKIKEKQILIEDFQGRIQHHLSLIYRLLSMQLDFIKPRNLLSKTMNQKSLLNLETFYQDSSQAKKALKVDFSKYITTLIKRLFESYKVDDSQVSVTIHISNIFLDIRTATLCGLIVSEMVSNSLKHAFPNQQKGKISIYFSQINGDKYCLKVKDNGIGFPDEVDYIKPNSRGLEIVNEITSQLNGSLKMKKHQGTEFTMTFSLKN